MSWRIRLLLLLLGVHTRLLMGLRSISWLLRSITRLLGRISRLLGRISRLLRGISRLLWSILTRLLLRIIRRLLLLVISSKSCLLGWRRHLSRNITCLGLIIRLFVVLLVIILTSLVRRFYMFLFLFLPSLELEELELFLFFHACIFLLCFSSCNRLLFSAKQT